MSKRTIHGIELTAPGGLEALFAYRRAQFGDAIMMAGEAADAGEATDDAADGAGDADQGTAGTDAGSADSKGTDADKGADIWADPAKAKAEIERLRAENGKDRTTAKTKAADDARNELTQTLGKALGLIKDGDDKPDPAKLTQQITEQGSENKALKTELAVYKAATKAGADPDALLDSRGFLAKIKDIDPTDVKAINKAITEAVTDNPKLALVRAAGASGSDFSGGSGEGALTKEKFDSMTPSEKNTLFKTNPTEYRKFSGR